jgi:hypothetical protein
MSDDDTEEYEFQMDPDEVPVYDDDDPDGDRREFLDDPDHRDHQSLFPYGEGSGT